MTEVASNSSAFQDALLRKTLTQASELLYGKNYLVDQKAFMAHLRQEALFKSAIHAGVVAVLTPSRKQTSVVAFLESWALSFGRSVSYTTVTRYLEQVCIQTMDPRIARACIKDISKSAVRKFARFESKRLVATLMFHTAFRAALLPNLAVLLVEQCIDMISLPKARWWRRFQLNCVRMLSAITGAAVGAAFGSLIAPGDGTLIGAGLGEALAYGSSLGLQMLLFKDFATTPGQLYRVGFFTVYLD
ncbi:hypothetical protein LEN26_018721 [Aphanomyces euteiches]|nr:hypothetical protein LEN26_018721 [Aphanomyces euteiches]KAH9129242.1 hypothetical protein AeMF1_000665 [Aphanomyces euteiches]KAH9195582.1 hypothetical protein AeNC1_002462 [Aphanomyces euteiches]